MKGNPSWLVCQDRLRTNIQNTKKQSLRLESERAFQNEWARTGRVVEAAHLVVEHPDKTHHELPLADRQRLREADARKRPLLLERFPSVCPEPVLAK